MEISDFKVALILVDVWRFVVMVYGVLSVTTRGVAVMLKLPADNWDSWQQVQSYINKGQGLVRLTDVVRFAGTQYFHPRKIGHFVTLVTSICGLGVAVMS